MEDAGGAPGRHSNLGDSQVEISLMNSCTPYFQLVQRGPGGVYGVGIMEDAGGAPWASFESWRQPSSNSLKNCPRLESNKGPQNYEFCALTS